MPDKPAPRNTSTNSLIPQPTGSMPDAMRRPGKRATAKNPPAQPPAQQSVQTPPPATDEVAQTSPARDVIDEPTKRENFDIERSRVNRLDLLRMDLQDKLGWRPTRVEIYRALVAVLEHAAPTIDEVPRVGSYKSRPSTRDTEAAKGFERELAVFLCTQIRNTGIMT